MSDDKMVLVPVVLTQEMVAEARLAWMQSATWQRGSHEGWQRIFERVHDAVPARYALIREKELAVIEAAKELDDAVKWMREGKIEAIGNTIKITSNTLHKALRSLTEARGLGASSAPSTTD